MLRSGISFLLVATLTLVALALSSCSDEHSVQTHSGAIPTASNLTPVNGVMELTISGLGSNHPQTEVKWLSGANDSATVAGKSNAITTPLPGFLDVASVATTTMDAAGIRYIATRIKVRNAPSCGTPGSCVAYNTARNNVTFFAVMMADTINQTAVSRFKRFDGSDANPALTTQLLPAHAIAQETLRVNRPLASLQVFTESELPAGDPGVLSVFPYGYVVKNVNSASSRTLPANPLANQYDGEVTFAFQIPLQASPTDDPFKISMRFQTADDLNPRVTLSTYEQNFLGDEAAFNRASALGSRDMVVLGGRVSQTTIGNPICRVRIAGPNNAPTAFLVDQIPATAATRAAPTNLSFVATNSDVSLGFCTNMATPTATSLVVNGSMSGRRRVAGGPYRGVLTGGGLTNRPNQLIYDITGERPYFRGELVSFTATAANTTSGLAPITPFVGSFRVTGSIAAASGTFAAANNFAMGLGPSAAALADFDGDGFLDVVTTNVFANTASIRLGDGAGNFAARTDYPVCSGPRQVVPGDFNGDGELDLAVACENPGTNVSILLGTGTGAFGAASSFSVGGQPFGLAVADFNADGRLDLVVTDGFFSNASILLGDGAGGFAPALLNAIGSTPTSVAVGDVNGDGVLDIVTANYLSNTVSLMFGNGSGGFGAANNIVVGSAPGNIKLGDVNGDGRLDLVVAITSTNSVAVLLGNSMNSFSAPLVFATLQTNLSSLVLGDVNGDGKLDIVLASGIPASNAAVFLGSGDGNFTPGQVRATGNNTFAIALGDLSSDGKLDVLTANFDSNNVSVLLGN